MQSPHKSNWMEVLRIQFIQTVKTGGDIGGQSNIMKLAGFNDSELEELKTIATMRSDDEGPGVLTLVDVSCNGQNQSFRRRSL